MEKPFVLIAIAEDEKKAGIFRTILEREGIEVRLSDETPLPFLSDLTAPYQGVAVLVRAKDAERAREALRTNETMAMEGPSLIDPAHIVMRCPHCREVVFIEREKRGRTEPCPRCGKALEVPGA